MDLWLLSLLIPINCFLCNSYPCVLLESLSHVINQESHVYSWKLGKIYLVHFWNFEISLPQKFLKSELGKLIPNFPRKHMITSTNLAGVGGGLPIFVITCFFAITLKLRRTTNCVICCVEVELIINNAPATYIYYRNSIETCLTTNHLLFDRKLLYSSNTNRE